MYIQAVRWIKVMKLISFPSCLFVWFLIEMKFLHMKFTSAMLFWSIFQDIYNGTCMHTHTYSILDIKGEWREIFFCLHVNLDLSDQF